MKGDYNTLTFPTFDYNSLQSRAVLPVQGFNKATVQIVTETAAIGSLILTTRKSLDGQNWTDVGTISAYGLSATIDVTGYAFLGVFVTTAFGSACVAPLILYAEYI